MFLYIDSQIPQLFPRGPCALPFLWLQDPRPGPSQGHLPPRFVPQQHRTLHMAPAPMTPDRPVASAHVRFRPSSPIPFAARPRVPSSGPPPRTRPAPPSPSSPSPLPPSASSSASSPPSRSARAQPVRLPPDLPRPVDERISASHVRLIGADGTHSVTSREGALDSAAKCGKHLVQVRLLDAPVP